MHVLYSFPDGLGKPGIGVAAYENVRVLIELGVEVTLVCTSVPDNLSVDGARSVVETLRLAGRRIPHRVLGVERAYGYHDRRAARVLERLAADVDVVHTWPRAVIHTAAAAAKHEIAVVREVSNTHTAHAYEVVTREHERLGVPAPHDNSHRFDRRILALEEREYRAADLLLVPSSHSRQTFLDRGFDGRVLADHAYGFDPSSFYPDASRLDSAGPLTYLFAARGEPRKGLHYLLEAWHDSGLSERARLIVCGEFIPGYRELLAPLLDDPSIECRGFVDDLGAVMRESDVFVLPSIEEGSALVTYAAQASGCAILVSEAAGARASHLDDGLVHSPGDVSTLAEHLVLVDRDRDLLRRLRAAGELRAKTLTWRAAGEQLLANYERAIQARARDSD